MNDSIVLLVHVGLVALLLTLLWQGWPQRLDVRLEQAQTVYQANARVYRNRHAHATRQ